MSKTYGDAPLLYNSAQTAQLLNISTRTLLEFVRAGDIAYIPLGAGKSKPRYGFHLDDINDFIRNRRVRENPPENRQPTASPSRPPEVYDIMVLREQRAAQKAASSKGRPGSKTQLKRLARLSRSIS